MARSSQGPRRATTWAAEQNQGPLPRIVRLGRPANDNVRSIGPVTKAMAALVALAALVAAIGWQFV